MSGISILMPVYNAGNYLKDCLDSILQQTYTDWELIAVDDHSTDASTDLLAEFAARDKRIRWVKNKEKGIIPALRMAFDLSSGNYITRMDADDRMAPKKLALLLGKLEHHGNGALATGLVEYFSASALGDGYKKYANWLNQLTLSEQNFSEIYKECVIPSPCWMVSRDDLVKCEGFLPDRYPEDYDLCFRFMKYGLKVVGVPEVLHYWRDHADRTSRVDPIYSDNRFLPLKVDYFAELELKDMQGPLVLWGAGAKGKAIAQLLLDKQLSFKWLTNNPRKTQIPIYGQQLLSFEHMHAFPNAKVMVAIASRGIEDAIASAINDYEIIPQHLYRFC